MRRWRSLGFVPLALLLVLLVHNLSGEREAVPKDQAGPGHLNKASITKAPIKRPERLLDGRITVIPLYKFGDLPARAPKTNVNKPRFDIKKKPPPSKPKVRRNPKPVQQQKPFVAATAPANPKPVAPQGARDGGRPVLVASYDLIGFERYLDVVESVGRFFVLLKRNGGTKIGPPVSLLLGSTLPQEQQPGAGLATARPHLVSDEKVKQRLLGIRLPSDAYSDRVALLFTMSFDRTLWIAVDKALRRKKLTLPQVAEVNGHYIRGVEGIFLKFDTARLRHNGGYVRLNDAIRVTL